MRTCFVPGCKTGYHKDSANISLFRPPKEENLLALWRKKIARQDRTLTAKNLICEKHFEDKFIQDKYSPIKVQGKTVQLQRGRKRLLKGAFPTVFPNLPPHLSVKLPTCKSPRKRSFSEEMAENEVSSSSHSEKDMQEEGEEIVVKVEIFSPPSSPLSVGDPCLEFPDPAVCIPEAAGESYPPSPESILGNITDGENAECVNANIKTEKDQNVNMEENGARTSALIFSKRNILGFERVMSSLSNKSGKLTGDLESPFHARSNYSKMSPDLIKAALKPVYKCNKCSKVFELDSFLRSHDAICKPDALECNTCGEEMMDIATLEKHKAEGTCGICKECGKVFKEANVFKAHKLLAHAEGATFKCSICKVSFERVFSLTTHIRKVHSKKSLECSSCGKFLLDQESLAEHQRNNTCAKCAKCGDVFSDLSSFRLHMLSEHTTKDLYICKLCNKEFTSMSSFNQHNRKYHPPKVYNCSTCGMILPDKQTLNVHEAEQACLKCYDCGRVFESNCSLKRHHLLTHPTDKQHKCSQCTRSFDKEYALIWHLRNVHKEANPYECKICGHRSSFPSKLKSHFKTHTKKRFCCTKCNKCFATAFVLKKHMLRVHEQNRPFACTQCPKKFAVKNFLTEHISHAHNPNKALKWKNRLDSISNEATVDSQ